MTEIILASASPRRIELIKTVVGECKCIPADIDESAPDGISVEQLPQYLAEQKAKEISKSFPEAVVIGCDTVVVIDGEALGKPKNKADAAQMLSRLSGRIHKVITGVYIAKSEGSRGFSEVTDVEFRALSQDEIDGYVVSGEPMDKAGAYGIQGDGAVLVKRINGDFYNVVGLPVARLKEELLNDGIIHR